MELEFSLHARQVMEERKISEAWIRQAIEFPDRAEMSDDGNRHCIKIIEERGGRFLRVVVNPSASPWRVVTAFFDRRIKEET